MASRAPGARAPDSIQLSRAMLELSWDGQRLALPAALLRAQCRCAECIAARRRPELPVLDGAIALVGAVPIGHYALQLRFSDGHERGIYPWQLLRDIAEASGSIVSAAISAPA